MLGKPNNVIQPTFSIVQISGFSESVGEPANTDSEEKLTSNSNEIWMAVEVGI